MQGLWAGPSFSRCFLNVFIWKLHFDREGWSQVQQTPVFTMLLNAFQQYCVAMIPLLNPRECQWRMCFFVWRASPISALSPARVTAKRNRLGSAPGRQLPWATDFKTYVGAVRCRATGCGWPVPVPKETRRFHIYIWFGLVWFGAALPYGNLV